MNRSGTCRCDICHKKGIPLEEHHINGKDIINPNHASNLTKLCPDCHTLIHNGVVIIEGWFTTTNGLELLWHSLDKSSFSGQDSKPYIIPSLH
jgi:hypothetical protein